MEIDKLRYALCAANTLLTDNPAMAHHHKVVNDCLNELSGGAPPVPPPLTVTPVPPPVIPGGVALFTCWDCAATMGVVFVTETSSHGEINRWELGRKLEDFELECPLCAGNMRARNQIK